MDKSEVLQNPGFGGRSPIDSDDELAAFIKPKLGRVGLHEIARLCRFEFGENRALLVLPSASRRAIGDLCLLDIASVQDFVSHPK